MLKTLLSLRLRALLSVLTGAARTKKKQSSGQLVGFALLMIVSFASLGFLFWHIFDVLSGPFAALGLGSMYFALSALLSFALMFIGSVFTAKSQLFEARDNELLLSLPIRPIHILLSRLFLLWLIAFLLGLPVAVPALLAWQRPIGAAGWFSAVVIHVLLLPCLCLTVSAFVGWVIHRVAARFGHKPIVTVLLWLLFLGGYIWLSFRWHSLVDELAADPTRLSGGVSALKIPVWFGLACAEGSLAALGRLVLLILPLFVLVCWLLAATFIRTATYRRGSAKKRYIERTAPVRSLRTALLLRELRRLWATPAYLFNSGLGVVMALLGTCVLLVKAGDIRAGLSAPGMEAVGPVMQLIAIPALCFLAAMIFFTAPSLSLEGKSLWLVKSLPIPARDFLRAKLRMQALLAIPPMLLLSVAASGILKTEGFLLALTLLLPALYCLFIGLVGLAMNLRYPNFNWLNETQAVKSGASVLLTMLIGMVAAAVPVLMYVIAEDFLSAELIGGVTAALIALTCLLLYRWLMRRGVAIFEQL